MEDIPDSNPERNVNISPQLKQTIVRLLLPPVEVIDAVQLAFGEDAEASRDIAAFLRDDEMTDSERLERFESWLWFHRAEVSTDEDTV